MPIESEVKREMIQLLLSSSNFEFNNINEVTDCASKLAEFILEKNLSQEPCGT